MPFLKLGPDQYKSPSGHLFNANQVRLYYANKGKFPGEKVSTPGAVAPHNVVPIVRTKPRLKLRPIAAPPMKIAPPVAQPAPLPITGLGNLNRIRPLG